MRMAAEPGTPEWWLRKLHGDLQSRSRHIRLMRNYYDGRHRLAFASQKFIETFGGLFNAFSDNWCGTVADASTERLNLTGFRVSPDETATDRDAWRIWQRNGCDSMWNMALTESHVAGECVATVWVGDDNKAEITFDPADTAIVALNPKHRQRRTAGLRMYIDDWGFEHAELFLPDRVYLFRSKTERASRFGSVDVARVHWVPDVAVPGAAEDGDFATMVNPLGVVPMVPMENSPRLWSVAEGCTVGSEIQAVIPLQDAANKLIADLLVASEASAAPLRWVAGYEPKIDPNTNEPIPPPWTKPGAGWAALQNPAGGFGSLPAGDLGNFVKAIDLIVQHIASISRTPPHYLSSSADRLSGESIKSAETGLVAKVRRKAVHLGENAEEVMRLAGRIEGIAELAEAVQMEAVWADPESRTEAEHIDAVGKKVQMIHVPILQAWEDAGYSPPQITRMQAQQAQQTLFAGLPPFTEGDTVEGFVQGAA